MESVETPEIPGGSCGNGERYEKESLQRAGPFLPGRGVSGLERLGLHGKALRNFPGAGCRPPHTADLAITRLKKAKAWRLLDAAKAAIADSKDAPEKVKSAQNQLDVAKKLDLDDEQQVVYQQLQEKLQEWISEMPMEMGMEMEMQMALVPAGEFFMGSTQGGANSRKTQQRVRVFLDAFYMDKFEVTIGMYAKFLKATDVDAPPEWNTMNLPKNQRRPVGNVNWSDASGYCGWAGKRLPTDPEWEKAARGTDERIYPWGNDLPTNFHANFGKSNSGGDYTEKVSPVGTMKDGKSPYGIYDMAGNVWEWTSSWFDKRFRVVRGGSWWNDPSQLRTDNYRGYDPAFRSMEFGFRCAKNP